MYMITQVNKTCLLISSTSPRTQIIILAAQGYRLRPTCFYSWAKSRDAAAALSDFQADPWSYQARAAAGQLSEMAQMRSMCRDWASRQHKMHFFPVSGTLKAVLLRWGYLAAVITTWGKDLLYSRGYGEFIPGRGYTPWTDSCQHSCLKSCFHAEHDWDGISGNWD